MKTIEENLEILNKIKLICDENDIEKDDMEIYEEALYEIAIIGNLNIIENLCEILDEKINVLLPLMDDIIENIFYISKNNNNLEEGIYIFLSNAYKITLNGNRLFKKFNKMSLVSQEVYQAYLSAIKRLDKKNLEILFLILNEIENDKYCSEVCRDKINFIKNMNLNN